MNIKTGFVVALLCTSANAAAERRSGSTFAPTLTSCPSGERLSVTPLIARAAQIQPLAREGESITVSGVKELRDDCAKTIVQAAQGMLKDKDGKIFVYRSGRELAKHEALPSPQAVNLVMDVVGRNGSSKVILNTLFDISVYARYWGGTNPTYLVVGRQAKDWIIGSLEKPPAGRACFTMLARSPFPIRGLGYFPAEHGPVGVVDAIQEISPEVRRSIALTWSRGLYDSERVGRC